MTQEDLERVERFRTADELFLRLVAVDPEGAVLGTGTADHGSDYRPGDFAVRTRVWKQHEGKGVGLALYSRLEAFVRENGGTSAYTFVKDHEPACVAWAQRRGYIQQYHIFESALALPEWDATPFMGAVEQAEAAGIRFTTLAEEGDLESLLPRFYTFNADLVHDIPGMTDRPRLPYAEWLSRYKEAPTWDPELIILAAEGDRWVGMCEVSKQNSGAFYNNFSGICPEYRGRGLSLALKVVALLKAKALGAPSIRTSNHSVNQPMLATNRRLGYHPLPGMYQLTKAL